MRILNYDNVSLLKLGCNKIKIHFICERKITAQKHELGDTF